MAFSLACLSVVRPTNAIKLTENAEIVDFTDEMTGESYSGERVDLEQFLADNDAAGDELVYFDSRHPLIEVPVREVEDWLEVEGDDSSFQEYENQSEHTV